MLPKTNRYITTAEDVVTPLVHPDLASSFGYSNPISQESVARANSPSEIMRLITPLNTSIPSPRPTLLTIPLEIRLQIYRYVLLSYPIHHAHLAPATSSSRKEDFCTTMLRPPGLSYPTSSPNPILTTSSEVSISVPYLSISPDFHGNSTNTTRTTYLRQKIPSQPPGKMPTALLTANRQIYYETRQLPFIISSFAFVNWFWSGVYAARQFSRSLRPWQSGSLRYTAVEVLGRDLWVGGMERIGGGIGGGGPPRTGGIRGVDGKGVGEWRELCELWSGVWGLRLKIKGSVFCNAREARSEMAWSRETGNWTYSSSSLCLATSLNGTEEGERKKREERGLLNVRNQWVIDGLLRMRSLHWIELEIEDEDVNRDIKVEFCFELSNVLTQFRIRDDGWTDGVEAMFLEQITEKEKSEKKWFAGEPGDDEDWHD